SRRRRWTFAGANSRGHRGRRGDSQGEVSQDIFSEDHPTETPAATPRNRRLSLSPREHFTPARSLKDRGPGGEEGSELGLGSRRGESPYGGLLKGMRGVIAADYSGAIKVFVGYEDE
ncbi:unnamed protein product, partial [Discosporangium mesarthrocarpum]